LLAEQLRDLSLSGLDFDIEVTGFEMGEIDLRIASLEDTPAEDEADPADILPAISAAPPVSTLGDGWVLGRHRVLCGNALDPSAFTALMGEERATMVFTDPPYNVPIEGHASGLGTIHHRSFPMAAGEMDRAEFTAFLRQTCCNFAAFSAAGSLHYLCMDWHHLAELLAAVQEVYGEFKNLRGRPPGAKNMKTLLTKALNELVVVTDNGGRRVVTKREAIVTQLVNRSAKADFKAIQILLGMLRDIGGDNDTHPSDPTFTEADQQIIQRIQARFRGEKG